MALKIIWSPLALEEVNEIFSYLSRKWTITEIINLESKCVEVIDFGNTRKKPMY